ncbi:hypothetical protein VTH82DRAFT_2676 [Thermothelomyces myriococcoides]
MQFRQAIPLSLRFDWHAEGDMGDYSGPGIEQGPISMHLLSLARPTLPFWWLGRSFIQDLAPFLQAVARFELTTNYPQIPP